MEILPSYAYQLEQLKLINVRLAPTGREIVSISDQRKLLFDGKLKKIRVVVWY
jgi:uncharacterized membrane protein YccF (DUF307 family)